MFRVDLFFLKGVESLMWDLLPAIGGFLAGVALSSVVWSMRLTRERAVNERRKVMARFFDLARRDR